MLFSPEELMPLGVWSKCISFLKLEDKSNCRFVCQGFKQEVDKITRKQEKLWIRNKKTSPVFDCFDNNHYISPFDSVSFAKPSTLQDLETISSRFLAVKVLRFDPVPRTSDEYGFAEVYQSPDEQYGNGSFYSLVQLFPSVECLILPGYVSKQNLETKAHVPSSLKHLTVKGVWEKQHFRMQQMFFDILHDYSPEYREERENDTSGAEEDVMTKKDLEDQDKCSNGEEQGEVKEEERVVETEDLFSHLVTDSKVHREDEDDDEDHSTGEDKRTSDEERDEKEEDNDTVPVILPSSLKSVEVTSGFLGGCLIRLASKRQVGRKVLDVSEIGWQDIPESLQYLEHGRVCFSAYQRKWTPTKRNLKTLFIPDRLVGIDGLGAFIQDNRETLKEIKIHTVGFDTQLTDLCQHLTHIEVLELELFDEKDAQRLQQNLFLHARNLKSLSLVVGKEYDRQEDRLEAIFRNMMSRVDKLTIVGDTLKTVNQHFATMIAKLLIQGSPRQVIHTRLKEYEIDSWRQAFLEYENIRVTTENPRVQIVDEIQIDMKDVIVERESLSD